MKNHIHTAIQHPLISASIVLFCASLFASFFNFLFNLFMNKYLSVSDYGTLMSLISLISIFALPAGAIVPSIIKFGGSFFARNEYEMVKGLFLKATKALSTIGVCIFIFFLLFKTNIAEFFKIENKMLIILASVNILIGYIGTVAAPLLQAKLSFKYLSFVNISGSFFRLFFGALAVLLGFSLDGILWGMFFSALIPYFITFIPLKFLFDSKIIPKTLPTSNLISYGTPAAVALFGLTSFITLDIILVKHFFDPINAGFYSGLALIGRVIFFFTAPISAVMFPLMVQKHAKNESYHEDFKLVFLMILVPSLCITLLYFTLPEFIVHFFLKSGEYNRIIPFIGLFGIYITVYSLLSMVVNFYLSINKTKVFIPIIIGAITQTVLIWFFHTSFLQIIIISMTITSLLLALLLLYYYLNLYAKNR